MVIFYQTQSIHLKEEEQVFDYLRLCAIDKIDAICSAHKK